LATAFYVCEAFGFEAGIDKKWEEAPEFFVLYTSIIIISALIILIPGAPLIGISLWSQVINGVLLPVVLVCMILIVNNKKIMGEHVNKPLNNMIGWVSIAILVFLSAMLMFSPLVNLVKKLF
jgi:Mn2+/Fe2+ NRAMP family transporter